MNDQERHTSWRRHLLTAWLAVGWVIALMLLVSKSAPFEAVRAQSPQPTPTASRGPYSPIGLTFDTCNNASAAVKLIAQQPTSPKAANVDSPPYLYAETIHNVSDLKDGNNDYKLGSDTDVVVYVQGTRQLACN